MTKVQDEKAKYNRTLREKIVQYFSLGEFNILCDDLDVDPEELKGGEKIEKANELIKYMHRHGQIDDLVDMLKSVRPNVNWEKDTIWTETENKIVVHMVKQSRASRDPDIHKLKRTAHKIDMAGISLTEFWTEITHDPDQKMIDRIVNEDIRFRVIFVHPDAAYLTQRWVEDDKKSLDELREIQKANVEICVTFYKQLTDYYHSKKNSPLKPKGRFKVKLTKFCPYFTIERYDSTIYWGLYTADSAGTYAPMFLITLKEHYLLFDKFRKHYIDLLRKNVNRENDDLYLIRMEGGPPSLNRSLANEILGKEMVEKILGEK